MGFMDKAKKLAEQAQTKLDEVQKQFNEGQSSGSGSPDPAVEYDQHGRPIRTEPAAEPAPPPAEAATPPHGDPLAEAPEPPAPPSPPSPPAPAAEEGDRNQESYEPPKLTGGDPNGSRGWAVHWTDPELLEFDTLTGSILRSVDFPYIDTRDLLVIRSTVPLVLKTDHRPRPHRTKTTALQRH